MQVLGLFDFPLPHVSDFCFSTNSQLELFQVNLADRSMAMTPVGAIKTDYRFVGSTDRRSHL